MSVTLESPPPPLFRILHSYAHSHPPKSSVSFCAYRIVVPPQYASSQRVSNFSLSQSQGGSNFVHDPRTWLHPISSARRRGDDDEDDDENDEDRSLDLLVKFVQNVFKKVSKRARKAVRSVLPVPISANLVGFSVNGVLVLAFLWILKAFLEAYFFWVFNSAFGDVHDTELQVVCTLGSVVFVSILLIRGIWSGVSFLQESRNQKVDELDLERHAWNGAQPVT